MPVAVAAPDSAVPSDPALQGLEPKSLWAFFEGLSRIPRPSKAETRVMDWLKEFAEQRQLAWQQDAVGNVVIKRPGSGGGEASPTVVIQGHCDMVCEKNSDVEHDFYKDAIRLVREGDWIKADGTTLGADNGMGVAAALALLDEPHTTLLPPLECLFTVDEEQGLTGAASLDPAIVSGRILLNLDTEEWGDIFIGCAGGGDCELTLPAATEAAPEGAVALQLTVSGLMGGHSGINIHEGRGNGLVFVAQAVEKVLEGVPGAKVVEVEGGDKPNAIAREARALLLVPQGQEAAVQAVVAQQLEGLHAQYGLFEKGLSMSAGPIAYTNGAGPLAAPGQCLSDEGAQRLLALLLLLPHGVLKMSHAVEGLVETSNNVASCHPVAARECAQGVREFKVVTSSRSSVGVAMEGVRDKVERVAGLVGARCTRGDAFPGWAPNPDSRVVQLTKDVFARVLGRTPHVLAVHAGLECGIIGERLPGLDCVSYGPTITGAHSPDERVQISTVEPFYKATKLILEEIAKGKY